jgi:formylmethanofuran dehydrogenase subunit E
MCRELTPWEKCVEFHGHVCPGLALGFKSAEVALRELGVTRSQDEELVAIVENDACGVDAIQVLTGCTFGKGNLIYRDYGKHVATFGNRKTGESVRIAVKPGVMERDPEHRRLMDLGRKGEGNPGEVKCLKQKQVEKAQEILDLPDDQFCTIARIQLSFPGKARIFESIICAECGEGAMEPRIRIKNGKTVCLECAGEEYTRRG